MLDKLKTYLQYLVPHHTFSRLMGRIANSRTVWFKNYCIRTFIKKYNVDMSSSKETNPFNYPTFNHFFIRELNPQARPIIQAKNLLACPVDGYVSQIGKIKDEQIFQAKGFDYGLKELLGGDAQLAKQFHNGNFATLYLAPKNYHRIHMPVTGTLQEMIHVPGKLFSVNGRTVKNVPQLFARNERVVTIFNTDAGPMAVILVGAMIVASITTTWAGEITPPTQRTIRHWHYADQNIKLNRGEELGYFKVGSTVIVLFAEDRVVWAPHLTPETEVQVGEHLATLHQQEN